MSTLSPSAAQQISIELPQVTLQGNMLLPENTKSLIIFAHGSGSSRFSPRNNMVAKSLNEAGLGTLLFDLLTAEEEIIDQQTGEYRFDIDLLAERLLETTDWLTQQKQWEKLNIGYFGSSTGAAAALIAAADRPKIIKAVVSRGGRPDLARDALDEVEAPTLLIVGELDTVVIALNQEAKANMKNINKLEIIPQATHLFEEPGTLEKVTQCACHWFQQYLD